MPTIDRPELAHLDGKSVMINGISTDKYKTVPGGYLLLFRDVSIRRLSCHQCEPLAITSIERFSFDHLWIPCSDRVAPDAKMFFPSQIKLYTRADGSQAYGSAVPDNSLDSTMRYLILKMRMIRTSKKAQLYNWILEEVEEFYDEVQVCNQSKTMDRLAVRGIDPAVIDVFFIQYARLTKLIEAQKKKAKTKQRKKLKGFAA